MAGENEIRAGGAYVEIGVKLNSLEAGLSKARGMLSDWGAQIAGMGGKMAAAVSAVVGPVVAAMKAFGDYGEQMDLLQQRTGMSQQALAALSTIAQTSGVSIGSLTSSVRMMQVAIAKGGKDSEAAFGSIGLSLKDLAGLAPEEQFARIAERIAAIPDPAQKTAAAVKIFGRQAMDLIPVLNAGRAGMEDALRTATRFGTVLSAEGMAKAKATDDAFDMLSLAFKGFTLRLGEAASGLVPMIEQLGEFIARAGVMLQQNPQLVQSFANIALFVGAAGAAFAALGLMIMAATSPAFLITGALMLVGASVLAVLDTLGVTDTGFADLFNSIQINGLGLADWFTWLWEHVAAGWGLMMNGLTQIWAEGWNVIVSVGHTVYQTVLEIMELLAYSINAVVETVVDSINVVLRAYNKAAGLISGRIQVSLLEGPSFTKDALDSVRKTSDQHMSSWQQSQKGHKTNMANLSQERESLLKTFGVNVTDIEKRGTGKSGISVDTKKAWNALSNIGGKVGELMRGLFESVIGKMPAPPEYVPGKSPAMQAAGAAGVKTETTMEATGTFLGGYGALMVGNARLIDLTQRSADAAERTAAATEAMAAADGAGGPEMS